MTAGQPPRVLHCVERLHTNAIETWLVRMHRHALARGVPVDWRYHVQDTRPGDLERAYPELSPLVIRSPVTFGGPGFFSGFYNACRQGRFEVVHIHGDLVSAPYALAARLAGVPKVVIHAHNADEQVRTSNLLKQRLYRPVLRRACLMLADRIVGISGHTLDTLLAGRKRRPGRDIVHYYGVDPAPFEGPAPDRAAFRRELGLAEDAPVLLFGGRMTPEKNPVFVIDVLAALRRLEPRAVAVFAGSGSLGAAVTQRAEALGVTDAVRLLGWRGDLPDVMRAADWFILPRPEFPMEGFGLAVLEAQLAGLRLLVSRGLPDDPFLPTASFRRLPLSAPPEDWAEAAMELLAAPAPTTGAAVQALAASPMDMDRALDGLMALYA